MPLGFVRVRWVMQNHSPSNTIVMDCQFHYHEGHFRFPVEGDIIALPTDEELAGLTRGGHRVSLGVDVWTRCQQRMQRGIILAAMKREVHSPRFDAGTIIPARQLLVGYDLARFAPSLPSPATAPGPMDSQIGT